MQSTDKTTIAMHTSIPGTHSQELLALRQKHVPRGVSNSVPVFVEKAEGAVVVDVDGNRMIDLAGAIGTLNAGHCPPRVVAALKAQLDQYIHPGFNVLMYEPYVRLAETLNALTPGDHEKRTFFLNSGAEAVENAVKIARKFTGRRGVLSFRGGFHGRTLLAMSLTSKVKPYKFGFGPFAADVYRLPYPNYYRAPLNMTPDQLDDALLSRMEEFFISDVPKEEIAAVIMEPVQGEGGFIVPSRRFVQGVRDICRKNDILFIADEVQTGFGRTGRLFAVEHFGVVPDLMTMSKSIAAGLPISAVTGRADVMDAPEPGEIGGTYGGSPLGCVAALEVIRTLQEEHLVERANVIGDIIRTNLEQLQRQYPVIGDVRGLGAMMAMELVKDPVTKEPHPELTKRILAECYQRGVVLLNAGMYGNVIRFLSPLVITDAQLEEAFAVLRGVFADLLG